MDPMDTSVNLDDPSPFGGSHEDRSQLENDPYSTNFGFSFDTLPTMPASNSLPVVSNNKPGFKYKYPEAAPTPPGEDDVEWNKVYTAADSRFYNRNGKSADRSRKYRQSGETYLLAIEMMAEKKEKLKAGGAGSKAAAKPKPLKKGPAVVKTEASNSSRDGTPCIDRVPMSISEQIKSEGRARNKAPSAAPSSKQGTPVPVPLPGVKTGSPPPKIEKPPPKKKGTAAPVKKPTKPKGPDRPKPNHTNHTAASIKAPTSDSESNDGGEYCICRGPDDHRMMVNCEGGCHEWYHCECINMDVDDARELLDKYICDRCRDEETTTIWRRMCRYNNVGVYLGKRLEDCCRRAARVTDDPPSKYCSDEHRVAFLEFIRDHKARQSDLPSTGGQLNVLEVCDILEHVKDNAELQTLGSKPRLPIPEGHDPDRPIGLDYLTPEEEEALSIIEAKKTVLQQRINGYGLQFQFAKMVVDRRQTTINHPEVKEKVPCGYDNRLALNEYEFAYWMTTQEGQTAFETGKLGPRTEETMSLSTRQYAPEHQNTTATSASETFNSVCLTSVKKCTRHRNWHKVHPDDCRHMIIVLKKELEKLKMQATEIIDDAEMREASKDYYAHNTVEQLF